jgi:hypothetical protein
MTDDKCWFCQGPARMTRPHVLLHCPNERLRTARVEAWAGKNPGGVQVLLANPRWERWLVKFLELSGMGRVVADENGARAAKMDECGVRNGGQGSPWGRWINFSFSLRFLISLL